MIISKRLKYALIFILLLCQVSASSFGQTDAFNPLHKMDDGKLETFLTHCLSFYSNGDRNALEDTLFNTMHQSGYQKTADDFLWDIYARARQTNKDGLKSKSLAMLLFWYHSNANNQDLLFITDTILKYNHHITGMDSIQLFNSRARAYLKLGIYNAALYNIMYKDTLMAKMERKKKKELQVVFPVSYSTLCFDMGLNEEAIAATKIEIDKILGIDSTANIATFYNNIGVAWRRLNKPDSAVHYFNLAIQAMLDHPQEMDPFFFHLVEGNLGSVLLLKNESDSAIQLLLRDVQSSLKLKNDGGYRSAIASQMTLAKYYLRDDKPREALNVMDSILMHINLLTHHTPNPDYYQIRGKAFRALGDLDSAYYYLHEYTRLSDSITLAKQESDLVSLKAALEVYKKEYVIDDQKKQLATEKTRNQKQKFLMFISLLLLGFVLIILFIILRSRQRQQQTNLQLKLQNEKISAQAKNLEELSGFKETMTNMIIHDLKNPLNTLISQAPSPGEMDYRFIKQIANRMLSTVMNLLDVHKYQDSTLPLNLENIRGQLIVDYAIERVSLLAKHKFVDIRNQIENDLTIVADKEILERVFENLFTNAIKFSPLNSAIVITGEKTENNQIKFKVIDHGLGVLEKDRNRLFEKYFQAEVRNSGSVRSSGLGLSFCKMAVEAHGGKIGVEANQARGSVFWFTINQGQPGSSSLKRPRPEKQGSPEINLSKADKEALLLIINKLEPLDYYELSKIRKVLSNANFGPSPGINQWREELLRAVKSGNKSRYEDLLGFSIL